MELKVTKELLNFLLRFRCPNCEFDTLDPILIQEHLFQCLKKQDENDVIGDSTLVSLINVQLHEQVPEGKIHAARAY